MPQPSLISGVAGTVHSEAYQGNQGAELGSQLVQMAEAFSRVHDAQKAAAQQKLSAIFGQKGDGSDGLITKLPIDYGEIKRLAKQAGFKLADGDTIAAIAQAGKNAKGGQPPPAGGSPPTGGQPKPASSTAAANPYAATAQGAAQFQKNMTPQQGGAIVFNNWAARARSVAQKEFEANSASADAAKAKALKDEAIDHNLKIILDPSPGIDSKTRAAAAGRLAQAGQLKLDLPSVSYTNATKEQKETMLAMYRGAMSDGERMQISNNMATTLIGSGVTAGPAMQAADSWSRGLPISDELQKQLGGMNFDRLYKQAAVMDTLSKVGLTGDEMKAAAQSAAFGGSIFDTLPPGFKTNVQHEVEFRTKQLAIEETHAQSAGVTARAELTRATTASKQVSVAERREARLEKESVLRHNLNKAKLTILELQGNNKVALDAYKAVVQAQAKGITVDPKQYQKVMDQMQQLGLDNPEGEADYLSDTHQSAPGGNPVNDELGDPNK